MVEVEIQPGTDFRLEIEADCWDWQAGVDFVVETAGKVIPIEIKTSQKPSLHDARHLQTFMSEYGNSSPFGLLPHNGTELERIAERVWAVPLGTALGR